MHPFWFVDLTVHVQLSIMSRNLWLQKGRNNVNFGDTIKDLRKQRRMTQRDLAERLGVNFTYISKIENGKLDVLPSEELIRRIAQILGANAEDLLDLAGKLDVKRLQQVAKDIPEAGAVLRRMQKQRLTGEQWKQIEEILDDGSDG
ncbi:MAG: XRE family transcriptional regulator [Anaerolineaceae bacterium]|nr:XRE family transcriptional regulator [Anaerolineaceae bacterium]